MTIAPALGVLCTVKGGQVAFPGCISPPTPGCLVGCCAVHCTDPQCVPQTGSGRRTSNLLSHTCRERSCSERVHPNCSSNRCTFYCSSHQHWGGFPASGGPVNHVVSLSIGTFNARRLWQRDGSVGLSPCSASKKVQAGKFLSITVDQPHHYDGLVGTGGREAAFLVRSGVSGAPISSEPRQ